MRKTTYKRNTNAHTPQMMDGKARLLINERRP